MKKILNSNIMVATIVALAAMATAVYSQTQINELVDVTDFSKGKFTKDYWQVLKRGHYRVSDLVIASKASACIQLHYTITKEGLIADPVIVKEVNGSIIKKELLKSLNQWKFIPSKANEKTRTPIRAIKFFNHGSDENIHAQCLIQK